MKIFSYYFFEDSPELKAYKLDLETRRKADIIKGCINYGKETDDDISWDFHNLDHDAGFSWTKSFEQIVFEEHKQLTKKGECHIFNRKKYCYHTGKEIITSLEQ